MSVDDGFRLVYEQEFARVFRAVDLVCGDRGLAEEATQEAFARALARWGRLGHRSWVAGWVTTTALNVARRQLRRRPGPSVEPRPERDTDAEIDLRAAVHRLPPRQQEAIALHYLLDLPVAEVAAAMDCDEGTVKTHLSRARAALERALEVADPPNEPNEPNETRSDRHA